MRGYSWLVLLSWVLGAHRIFQGNYSWKLCTWWELERKTLRLGGQPIRTDETQKRNKTSIERRMWHMATWMLLAHAQMPVLCPQGAPWDVYFHTFFHAKMCTGCSLLLEKHALFCFSLLLHFSKLPNKTCFHLKGRRKDKMHCVEYFLCDPPCQGGTREKFSTSCIMDLTWAKSMKFVLCCIHIFSLFSFTNSGSPLFSF